MGQHHARVYSGLPEVNLVAVCDQDAKRGKEIARKYKCRFYQRYLKMLKEEEIGAVSIVVPTFWHCQVAGDVLDRGIHVLLEKPMTTTLQEARKIIKKAKKKKVKLMIGHIERFNPAVTRLKKLIKQGVLGKVVALNIKRVGGPPRQVKGDNVIVDLAIHDIDIANYLFESPPEKIYCFKSKNLVREQEDSANILLKYGRASALIEVNWITPVKIRTLEVTGTRGFASLDYIKQTLALYENRAFDKRGYQFSDFKELVSKFSCYNRKRVLIKKEEPLKKELESFVNCILKNETPLTSGEAAYQVLRIALKI